MLEFRPAIRRASFTLVPLALLAPSLHAAPCGADAQSPISTDRPQITEASTVVPCGSLQFENGFAVTGNAGRHGLDLPETWMRWGVPAKGEIRFAVPDYFTNDDTSSGLSSGMSDVVLGYKQQLGPTHGPLHGLDVSVIPSLSFPSGSNRISSGGYDPLVQIPWSRSLSKNWTVAGMFALMDPTQPGGRNVTGQGTLYFDRRLTSTIDAWAEYSGGFPERGGPQNIINFGACYKPTPHQQIDFHWSYGLSAAVPDYSVGLGYSVRFQVFRSR
jgi:Putative MetA-pathway of phenol degradation